MTPRILVIKLGALGDFVQAFGPFAAIRAHHPDARITLLTTPPFAALARRSPWFDVVWEDGRPSWTNPLAVWRLATRLRAGRFQRVYDLQTSTRSSRYRLLIGPRPDWSGIAPGASHPHDNPDRERMHTFDRQRDQLRMAGVKAFPAPDLSWLDADMSAFALPDDFALLIPGASPHRPGKRWPAERFGELAARLDIPCAILGGPAERDLAATIRAMAPATIDLTGRTDLLAIGALARRARFAVGNDTGPTHVAAAAGCPTVTIFGADSDPSLCAPRGERATFLREIPIDQVSVEDVLRKIGEEKVFSSPNPTSSIFGSGAGV